jgi:predicted phage terminase large subunit-like protein
MNADPRAVLDAVLRRDLRRFIHRSFQTLAPGESYQPAWYIDAIACQLERCYRREIKRLVITLPPRYLKSICASVAFPAWALGHDPSLKFICASYSSDLAAKHARDCRKVMASEWYRRVFPGTALDRKKMAELEFHTTRGGYRLSTSVGGTLTGLGGNFILIDDPMKAGDAYSEAQRKAVKEWYDSTLYSRLNSKTDDVIILIAQRLHLDDLIGHVLEKGGWEVLSLPAIAEVPEAIEIAPGHFHHRGISDLLHPERESPAILNEIKSTIGSQQFSAQYQQAPVPASGNLIKWAWFKTYRDLPAKGANDRIVQSWDTALKADELNDYSVCTTWLVKGKDYFLVDVYRQRLEFPDLRRKVIELWTKHRARAVLIEDKGSGTLLIQELRRTSGAPRPIPILPAGDKITRMAANSAKIEAGHVHLPERAAWLGDFRTELLAFPAGRYDDQVDSLSQFLTWLDQRVVVRRGFF